MRVRPWVACTQGSSPSLHILVAEAALCINVHHRLASHAVAFRLAIDVSLLRRMWRHGCRHYRGVHRRHELLLITSNPSVSVFQVGVYFWSSAMMRPSIASGFSKNSISFREHQSGNMADRRPRCSTNGSKSRSLNSSVKSCSMHAVAISVSMVLRAVMPIRRNVLKLRAA